MVGAIVASWAFDFKATMPVLGAVPSGLPHIGLPQVQWSWELIGKLAPTAFAMFVVILAQSAATARAYAARYNESFSENTDLVGLGLANIGAGLSGTFVVNGSPTQSQMVDSAGGRTQLSALVTAVIVLLASPKKQRFSLPNARFLIHQPSTGVRGDASDIEIEASEILKCREKINSLIARETGQTVEKVDADTRRNFWMGADEALEYGLVGKVVANAKEI